MEPLPLVILISALLLVSVFGMVLLGAPLVRRRVRRRETRYGETLNELFLFSVTPRSLVWASVMSAGVAGLLVGLAFGPLWGLAAAWLASFVPALVLHYMLHRRRSRLNTQLVDGILALSNSVKAGLTLVDAIRLVEENAPDPTSQEFGLILREYEHGVTLEECLDRAALRLTNPSHKLVFAALKTSRERGGDLGDTLDRISESVREIHRLEDRVRTLTAQGRLAVKMMLILPIFIAMILYMIDPEGIVLLFTDPVGHILLTIIVLLDVLGLLWIRRIVHIDI